MAGSVVLTLPIVRPVLRGGAPADEGLTSGAEKG